MADLLARVYAEIRERRDQLRRAVAPPPARHQREAAAAAQTAGEAVAMTIATD